MSKQRKPKPRTRIQRKKFTLTYQIAALETLLNGCVKNKLSEDHPMYISIKNDIANKREQLHANKKLLLDLKIRPR